MTDQPYGFLTQTGRNKEALALANGDPIVVTHIVFGDGDYAPTGGETELQNETARVALMAQGTTDQPNEAFFRVDLAVDDGPYNGIREAGLIDEDGDLIAIVKYPTPINKPVGFQLSLDIVVVFSELENLVIRIEASSSFVPGERQVNTSGLATGGGDLTADRTIDVPIASQARAEAGAANDVAITPLRLAQAIAVLAEQKFLGTYTNLAALNAAHPAPPVGSYGHVDAGAGQEVKVYIWDDNDNQFTEQAGASSAETATSILSKYLSNPNTNQFTDALLTKLNGIDLASQAEAQAGAENSKTMTPLRVKQAIQQFAAALDLATQSEAEVGGNNTKAMTPLRVKQAIQQFATGFHSQHEAQNAISVMYVSSAIWNNSPWSPVSGAYLQWSSFGGATKSSYSANGTWYQLNYYDANRIGLFFRGA